MNVSLAKKSVRLLAAMEAGAVTGPAKNLIDFCKRARHFDAEACGFPRIASSLVTFERVAPDPEQDELLVADSENPFVAAARDAGIETFVIRERFRFDRRVVRSLRLIIERARPDIIQTHNVKSHFLLGLSGQARTAPWVAFHHGYTTTNLKMRAYNHLDRWSLNAADRVVTVSHAFARDLARLGVRPERIRVLHNSIDTAKVMDEGAKEEALALKARMGIAEGEKVILTVGRLSREKGHADLIAALGAFKDMRPAARVRLVVVGDGPERAKIEKIAAQLGVGPLVVWAGQVGNVGPYYAMADLLALPSHSEGSPNVLLEAMAARVPVVATSVGGVPEIVTHEESALLVPPREPAAMADSIDRILKDGGLGRGLSDRAHSRVVKRHSPEARLQSLLEIYRELMPVGAESFEHESLGGEFHLREEAVARAAAFDQEVVS
jgi:glycosyltransferase involved in cell wall biosynthesis